MPGLPRARAKLTFDTNRTGPTHNSSADREQGASHPKGDRVVTAPLRIWKTDKYGKTGENMLTARPGTSLLEVSATPFAVFSGPCMRGPGNAHGFQAVAKAPTSRRTRRRSGTRSPCARSRNTSPGSARDLGPNGLRKFKQSRTVLLRVRPTMNPVGESRITIVKSPCGMTSKGRQGKPASGVAQDSLLLATRWKIQPSRIHCHTDSA